VDLARFQDVKLTINVELAEELVETEEEMKKELSEEFTRFQTVQISHSLQSLEKINGGQLCIDVWRCCQKYSNPTSLETIMRGLLPPDKQHQAEDRALEDAEEEAEIFETEVNFLFALFKKGRMPRSYLRNVERFPNLRERIEEVEQMKELYEEQQRLKLEAELEAYRIKKEQEDKEKKKAKLNEMKPKK